jgi:hypothetical protein
MIVMQIGGGKQAHGIMVASVKEGVKESAKGRLGGAASPAIVASGK